MLTRGDTWKLTGTVLVTVLCLSVKRLGITTDFLHRLEGVIGLLGTSELELRSGGTEVRAAAEESEMDHFDRT